jgi:cytochrome c2
VIRRLLGPALGVAAILAVAGCGTGGMSKGGDAATGKALFIQKCGSCHTMADAATQGKVGPNLDGAFGFDKKQGYEESTIQQVVRDQIELAEPPMPANLVRGEDADSVALYVAKCSAWTKPTPCVTASQIGTTGTTTTTAPPPPPPPPGTTGTTGTTPSGGGDATKGKALYTSLGCIGCHSLDGSKGTGPTFKGLAGRQTKLTDGTTVTADDAYLLESIEDPDKQIVAGFSPGIMSAVIKPGQVSQQDAADLIAFIKEQK